MPWLFLLVSLVGAVFTYNAVRPTYAGAHRATVSFFAGWITSELALHHIVWQGIATALFIWAGALATWPGALALAITLVSWGVLGFVWGEGRHGGPVVERALRTAFGDDYASHLADDLAAKLADDVGWRQIVLPFPIRRPTVERIRNIRFARAAGLNLDLDVHRPRNGATDCPVLMQIHGGAWVLGTKDEQGLPLMMHMAERGWVCFSVNYRLSPHATFPDHLIDLKRALAWIREHGREYGADPDFVVVTGGSAGGHLAALMALTANDPEYQSGFEDANTSVDACVSFYGVYDFADREQLSHNPGRKELLEKQVMKASVEEAPEAYDKASPITRLRSSAPPFLVIHGDRDTLVPVEEARRFVMEFRRLAHDRIAYAEIPGAQHAFEIFPSLRSNQVVQAVARFLMYRYSAHRAARDRSRSTSDNGSHVAPRAPAASLAPL